MNIFRRFDPVLCRSIDSDNDTAFARQSWLREALEMATYFCDANASWQKGRLENANGRLRRWLPRQTNLDDVSDVDMTEMSDCASPEPLHFALEFRHAIVSIQRKWIWTL